MFEINNSRTHIEKIFPVKVSKKDHQRINELAKYHKTTMAEIVRQMVEYCLKNMEYNKN